MKQPGGELPEPFPSLPEGLFSGPQCLLHLLLIRDVDAGPDIPFKGAIGPKSGHARVEDPAIFSIEPLQAVFHPECLPCIEGFTIRVQTALQIVRMDALAPPVTDLVFQWPAGEIEPMLVGVGAEFVGAGHPDHHWSCFGQQPEASFALAYN